MALITRRNLFLGLIAAPVIVRASSLMPISAKALDDPYPNFGCFFAYEGGYSLDDPIIYRLKLLNETWVSRPGTHAYFSGAFEQTAHPTAY